MEMVQEDLNTRRHYQKHQIYTKNTIITTLEQPPYKTHNKNQDHLLGSTKQHHNRK